MYYPKNPIKRLGVNTEGRDFVCGDIHGSFSCLETALAGVNFDVAKDRLISVGDIIDRGPENAECLHLLLEPWFHMVKGNHELLMETHFKEENFPWWLFNGGAWGLRYKKDNDDESLFIRDLTTEVIAELPLLITVDMANGKKFHVIHAELPPHVEVTDEHLADEKAFYDVSTVKVPDGDVIQWGRYVFGGMIKRHLDERTVRKLVRGAVLNKSADIFNENLSHIYSGHSVLHRPVQFYGQTCIDTGAYYSYQEDAPEWAGLTLTEPLTGKFWFANDRGFKEIEPIIIGEEVLKDDDIIV